MKGTRAVERLTFITSTERREASLTVKESRMLDGAQNMSGCNGEKEY
jgi:hypothetical protein